MRNYAKLELFWIYGRLWNIEWIRATDGGMIKSLTADDMICRPFPV